MSDERLSDFDEPDAKESNLRPELGRERTETIDLASLLTTDVSTTGSFDIHGKIWATTFGKLLQALPIPAFLIDAGHKVIQANQACAKVSPEYETILGAPFCGFFRSYPSYEKVRSVLEEVFATRKTRVVEAVLSVGERQVWARITCRSLRIMGDRIVLALIEDLTNEKIQLQTNERLRQELERRVEERTVMLTQAHESLKKVEQRYRSLFEDAPLMYVITRNERGVPYISDCNQFFLRTVGYSREDVVEQPLGKFYSHESIAEILEGGGYERSLAGEFLIGERRLRTRNGSLIPTLLYTTPEEDPSGRVIGTRAMFVDITDRKKAEEALKESETKYRLLHETMRDAFVVVDMTGRILEANHAYCFMLGYSEEELRNLTYVDLTPQKWHAFEARILEEQILVNGYSDVYCKEYRKKDGTIFPVELRTFLVRDDAGQASAMWAIVRNIAERKRLEEEKENLVNDLREALAQVKKLSGMLPICASCKKIRDDKGYWTQIEAYIGDHSEAEFSHSICPECARKLYPELYEDEPN